MKRTIILFVLLAILRSFNVHAQVVKGNEMAEILQIADTYRQFPNLSFTINYTYADSTQPSTIIQQLSGTSQISNGNYYTYVDSVIVLQGGVCNLAIFQR